MMRIRLYLPSIEHKSGKLLLASVIIITLVLGYLGYLYYVIQDDKTASFNPSKEIAQAETSLTSVNSVSRYHGMHQYDIVAGVDDNGEKGMAFIPVTEGNEKEEVIYVTGQEITSKETMQRLWSDQCMSCTFIEIKPAIHQDVPLWEITYKDEDNRYVFDYYKMENGKRYEVFRLK
ncbi:MULTISPECIES: cell wall elongation regulator TseB-like domain-containing protein [Pontibacillus]|uniref:DUF5590 domain-containing protein n=1 Tax=Pontibacillus chungwhensis TaxID=265426 RepID=A0ABY8UVA1_9BACI|nr:MULTISPECIES: DUF5590 domain-containing protein [Pontibacillus]WIF96355.1 DUF5590 domain-containing protein [Pontibacillus chungwhensis]